MLAAVYRRETRGLRVEEIPEPSPEFGQVKVRVLYASICGSDLFLIKSHQLPDGTILGHEMSGVVEEVGDGVRGLARGCVVIVRPMGCGGCPACKRAEENLCPQRLAIGLGAMPGAFAQFIVVPQGMVIPVPAGLDAGLSCLAEPLATALHAIRLSEIHPRDKVVVLGAGGIGLCCVAVLRALGVQSIFVSEPHEARAMRARSLGAQAVVDPGRENLGKAVEKWSGAEGIRVVLECAGKPETLKTALDLVAPGGKVVLVGLVKEAVEWLPASSMLRQLRIQGSFSNTQAECRECLEMLAGGRLCVEPMLEGKIPLTGLPSLMDRLVHAPGEGKILVEVNQASPGSASEKE